MNRLSATIRITFGLACLSVTVLLFAILIGLVPDRRMAIVTGRAALAESIAVHCSLLASRHDIRAMKAGLEAILERNDDMVFVGVRRHGERLVIEVSARGDDLPDASQADRQGSRMVVPIMANDQPWGSVEVMFRPFTPPGVWSIFRHPVVRLSLFVFVLSFAAYLLYLRKMLRALDPSSVIPQRVRTTLNTFAEGLLVLDSRERIVLANQAFADTMDQTPEDLQGRCVSELPWITVGGNGGAFPWKETLAEGKPQTGVRLGLQRSESDRRTFQVNTTAILGDDGKHRGALASFDDVTSLENSRTELVEMLQVLRSSRDEIRQKNRELQHLADRDPLTGCLNRRSFFEQFETHWAQTHRHGYSLTCVMLDIDHFKSINDTHGHTVGDQVLQKLAEALKSTARDGDVICRYGGEEFCILFPHVNIENGYLAAQRYQEAVQSLKFQDFTVTASLGLSATGFGAGNPQELIDQADKCLYAAKNKGRNRIDRWDDVRNDPIVDLGVPSEISPLQESPSDASVPFHAVTALISALAYRDIGTAEHSRRVADLCVAAASQVMSASQAYILEIAALLHDVGKIGVPDSILLKPGPLTEDEWQVMSAHDTMGVGIVESAFRCRELTKIIESHHAWYGGKPNFPELPIGQNIPLGARILAIADAFDAMVSDRVYRKGCSCEEAFAELRRCAGIQFDPDLTERFIDSVLASNDSRTNVDQSISKQTALGIGLQIENLAAAMDRQDAAAIVVQAERLKRTATKYGVGRIAICAEELEQLAGGEADLMTLAEVTNELLDLCRSTQRAYFSGVSTASLKLELDSAGDEKKLMACAE